MKIVALIASIPRFNDLLKISLPSIALQVMQPDAVVIVSDRKKLTLYEQAELRDASPKTQLYFIENYKNSGVAGTWNTGIEYIQKHFGECYLSILDDDDIWLPSHLFVCSKLAKQTNADLVVSGLAVLNNQVVVAENIPSDLTFSDFLVGNPGWQGSNTFIRLSTIICAGCFTNGLISSNDKDLAIKVLSMKNVTVAYSKIITVHWQCGHNPLALSAIGSKQKLTGCAQFIYLHGNKMNADQKMSYYQRMDSLFNLKAKEIISEIEKIEHIWN